MKEECRDNRDRINNNLEKKVGGKTNNNPDNTIDKEYNIIINLLYNNTSYKDLR